MTFKDLVWYAANEVNVPSSAIAGAWLEEQRPVDRVDAIANTAFTDEICEALYAWLQAPTDKRQDRLLNLLRQSVEAACAHDYEAAVAELRRNGNAA